MSARHNELSFGAGQIGSSSAVLHVESESTKFVSERATVRESVSPAQTCYAHSNHIDDAVT
jgi:hypothetical protein